MGLFSASSTSTGPAPSRPSPSPHQHTLSAPVSRHDVLFDEDGRIGNWEAVRRGVREYGVQDDPVSRRMLYPFLLGVFSPSSTRADRVGVLRRLRHVHAKLVFVCEQFGEGRGSRAVVGAEDGLIRVTSPGGRGDSCLGGDCDDGGCDDGGGDDGGCDSRQSTPVRLSPPAVLSSPLPSSYASFHEAHRLIVIDAVRTDLLDLEVCGDWDASVFWSAVFGGGATRNDRQTGTSAAAPSDSTPATSTPATTTARVFVGDGLPELMQVHSPLPKPAQQVASGLQPIWTSEFASATIDASCKSQSRHTRRQMVRLINLLSVYAVHDPENGYCQGMSDLGAVFVAIESDDALAFACFERLMRSARENFRHDERGMKAQLGVVREILRNTDRVLFRKLESLGGAECMFVYRMVVVLMRRDLPVGEALRLWEICWAYEEGEGNGEEGEDKDDDGDPSSSSSSPSSSFEIRSNLRGANSIRSTVKRMNELTMTLGGKKHVQKRTSRSWRGTPTSADADAVATADIVGLWRPTFFLQFVASVIKEHRAYILNECTEYDDLMRHFNGVDIDFEATAARARKRHTAYEQGATLIQALSF